MTNLFLAAFLSLQTADTASTCVALRTGRFVEANVAVPTGCAGLAAVKIGVSLAAVTVIHTRVPAPRRKWAYLVLAGVSTYPVIHNVRQIRRHR